MHKRIMLGLTVTSLLALGLVAPTAGATRFSITSASFRSITTSFTIFGTGASGMIAATCDLTMMGTLHTTTWGKTANNLIGRMTRAYVNHPSCTEGDLWALGDVEFLGGLETIDSMPWHIQYSTFAGALPAITRVVLRVIDASFLVRTRTAFGQAVTCLYRSTTTAPMILWVNLARSGEITGLEQDFGNGIPVFSGGPNCPNPGFLSGQGTVTIPETTTRIFVRLI
jgi:hypothetical protein